MELVLQRDELGQIDTPGTVRVNGAYQCRVLEDPVREIPNKPVTEWKIPKKTAVGAGRYRVTLEDSDKFGPETITINGVMGYDYIRMHAGQDEEHTDGCPLTAGELEREADDGSWRIKGGTSRPALALLKHKVKQAIAEGDQVWITIYNPKAWYAMHGLDMPAFG